MAERYEWWYFWLKDATATDRYEVDIPNWLDKQREEFRHAPTNGWVLVVDEPDLVIAINDSWMRDGGLTHRPKEPCMLVERRVK